jgi:hypothetical protein
MLKGAALRVILKRKMTGKTASALPGSSEMVFARPGHWAFARPEVHSHCAAAAKAAQGKERVCSGALLAQNGTHHLPIRREDNAHEATGNIATDAHGNTRGGAKAGHRGERREK